MSPALPPYLLGASNAMAAGMMISASGNMIYESWVLPADSLAESLIGLLLLLKRLNPATYFSAIIFLG